MIYDKRIAKRYAKAFLSDKVDRKEIDVLAEEMKALVKAFHSDQDIEEFFASPVTLREDKIKVVKKIGKTFDLSPYTVSLLELLIKKDRIIILDSVAEELDELSDRIHERIRVKVTTAVEPSTDDIGTLSERIGTFFGGETKVERQIDPSIIGGFILEGDGKRIDLSIRGQIRRILTKL